MASVEVISVTLKFVGLAKLVGGDGVGLRFRAASSPALYTGSGAFSVEQPAKKRPLTKNKIKVDFFIKRGWLGLKVKNKYKFRPQYATLFRRVAWPKNKIFTRILSTIEMRTYLSITLAPVGNRRSKPATLIAVVTISKEIDKDAMILDSC